ncbi:MAG TPA: ABC transporter permease [Candidatus Dormibacteraeota bacterium]|jgi:oligopeptide transport system permease protein|nr:ABC transporter permease [Candidatus Dormibacteraeota bacterium]
MFTRGALLYIGQRLILIAFTAFAVSSIVFLGIHRLPGDALLNERRPDPGAERELLHYYHLDLPLSQQYFRFVGGVLHGDLGESLVNRSVQITPLLLREARVSAEVGGAAIVFTIGIGLVLGVIAAVRQNTWVDYLATTTSVIGYSMPNFVVASILFLFFGVLLYKWTGGTIYYNSGWTGNWGTLDQIILPGFALGFPYASIVARLTRASMLEVIRQDYVRTARAKGLTDRIVIIRHALRNALIPVVTILGPLVIGIITGSVVIENIFGIPGLGKEFATSILQRDYNIVIGLFTFYAIFIALANLLVDLLYTVIDPRIRY